MSENLACPSCGTLDVREITPMMGVNGGIPCVMCEDCKLIGPKDRWNVRAITDLDPPGPTWDEHDEALSRIKLLRKHLGKLLGVSATRDVVKQRIVNHAREAYDATEPARPRSPAKGRKTTT